MTITQIIATLRRRNEMQGKEKCTRPKTIDERGA